MTRTPLILEVRGNSLDDGPGIRTVIFFKGCPLTCEWCHNPESKKAVAEISFEKKVCVGCGVCMETCPRDALSRDNTYYIDRETCDLCFKCTEECPSGALSRVGSEMGIEEIVDAVLKDKPFYNTSGGGVTISGGEATLHMEFLGMLAKHLKDNGIQTLLETCGYFDFTSFENMVLPYLDIIYFDIKFIDSNRHKTHCGVPNKKILENVSMLQNRSKSKTFELLARVPLVPGITDDFENLKDIAEFLEFHGLKKAAILDYNPLWREKLDQIGLSVKDSLGEEMTHWMKQEKVLECKKIFRNNNIHV